MLCLFEDRLASNFIPVASTRHVAHLLVGTMTLRARALRELGEPEGAALHGRKYIRDYYRAAGEMVDPPSEPTLFVNARAFISRELAGELREDGEWIMEYRGDVVAARLGESSIAALDWDADALDFSVLAGVKRREIESATLYAYLWDLVYDNGAKIEEDFSAMQPGIAGVVMTGAHLLNHASVAIGAGSVVKPGAVIDASSGAVVIGEDVEIMPNAVIEGPCYIGDHSKIKIGAKIYGQTSIGPWCKVGGEVEGSIILGYSNKQHDGFLGHSYLGRWVNLGADTNTSDLKNNYGTIRVTLGGREVNTGRIFVGSLIGDHAKTGINTMLNTGTVIGVGANVFGGGFPKKAIPPFAWGGFDDASRYRLDEMLSVAATVMARRNIELTDADAALLRYLHESAGEG
jgi:UDP-N-acetylglucosamine diphosphorylase/glucosamine-1-phosphate N-acetyltransferase